MSLSIPRGSTHQPHRISPKVWGPGMWMFLESKMQWDDEWQGDSLHESAESADRRTHNIAFIYGCGDTQQSIVTARRENHTHLLHLERDTDKELIRLIMHALPGETCRANLHVYVQIFPPINGTSKGRWLFNLHNEVNMRTGKPTMLEGEARRRWMPPRASSMQHAARRRVREMRAVVVYVNNSMGRDVHWHGVTALNVHIRRNTSADPQRPRLQVERIMSYCGSIVVVASPHVLFFGPVSNTVQVASVTPSGTAAAAGDISSVLQIYARDMEMSRDRRHYRVRFQMLCSTAACKYDNRRGDKCVCIDACLEMVYMCDCLGNNTQDTQKDRVFADIVCANNRVDIRETCISPNMDFSVYQSLLQTLGGLPIVEVIRRGSRGSYVVIHRPYRCVAGEDKCTMSVEIPYVVKGTFEMAQTEGPCTCEVCSGRSTKNGAVCVRQQSCGGKKGRKCRVGFELVDVELRVDVHMLTDHFVPGILLYVEEFEQFTFVGFDAADTQHSEDFVAQALDRLMLRKIAEDRKGAGDAAAVADMLSSMQVDDGPQGGVGAMKGDEIKKGGVIAGKGASSCRLHALQEKQGNLSTHYA